jgi:hypothetical protein
MSRRRTYGLSFSWKRAIGLSGMRSRIAKETWSCTGPLAGRRRLLDQVDVVQAEGTGKVHPWNVFNALLIAFRHMQFTRAMVTKPSDVAQGATVVRPGTDEQA